MGIKKGGGGFGGGIIVAVGLAAAAIGAIPKEVWILLGVALVVWGALHFFGKSANSDSGSSMNDRTNDDRRGTAHRPSFESSPRIPVGDRLVEIKLQGGREPEYLISASAPTVRATARWVMPGETVTVNGFELPGGMLYMGGGLRSPAGTTEPSLIDSALGIAARPVDTSTRLMEYWPFYSRISDEARRAYLQWLAGGRRDPNADAGYVFLFFYGLERRLLIDAGNSPEIAGEYGVIRAEIARLLDVYGSNNSFRRYANELIGLCDVVFGNGEFDAASSPPRVPRSYELPFAIKVGLAEFASRKTPLPANWALAWALADAVFPLRTPTSRCPEEFANVFMSKYRERYDAGLVLPTPRTRLKVVYRPASPGLSYEKAFASLPDVTVSTKLVGEMRSLIDEATAAITPYSRFLGRNPLMAGSIDALLHLPAPFWPEKNRAELADLRESVGHGVLAMSLAELSGRFKSAGALNKDKLSGLASAMSAAHIGMEPDVLSGAKVPKAEEKVVLFAVEPGEGEVQASPAYRAAAVTVGLAVAVASADGEAAGQELTFISRQIDAWEHLSASHRKRLKANLRLILDAPPKLASFKKTLEALDAKAKRALAHYLAALAQVDAVVSPAEVKFLEKV